MKNKLKIFILSGLLASTTSTALFAAEINDISEDRIIFAKEIWEEHQENPLAQFYIAEQHYLQGDKEKALSWYLRSAKQGVNSSINNAQIMIEKNSGVKSNMDDVVGFMSDKGLEGDLFSQLYLGDIYRDGRYSRDYEKSYFWYNQAASQGDSKAEYYVGNMTISGVGTFQNVPKGLRYLESLAEKGHVGAMFNIAKVYKIGFNVGKNHKIASKWFHQAAKDGHVESMYEIADSLERGFGVDKNEKEALDWFETSALHGDTKAAYRAGMLNLFLSTVNDDYTIDKAIDWLSLAAEEGNIEAQLRMGDLYFEGKFGISKSFKSALKWYTMAGDRDNKFAWKKISMIYRVGGYGIDRDDEKYKQAIKRHYNYKNKSMAKPKEKLKLFNYNIFKF
jgi:TPR repeat protein